MTIGADFAGDSWRNLSVQNCYPTLPELRRRRLDETVRIQGSTPLLSEKSVDERVAPLTLGKGVAAKMIFHSEDLRHVPEIWQRAWAVDMPDVATPYRVHGGVI